MRRSVGGCIPGLCKLHIKMYYPSKLLLTGMLQKHLPSIESWLQKMQLKSAKAKQKLNFDSGFYGTSMVGKACLGLAGPGLDVAMDQLPSPWPLGAPAGKDICQRESWHLYFLLNLGLFLSHSFISFLFFFFFFCS